MKSQMKKLGLASALLAVCIVAFFPNRTFGIDCSANPMGCTDCGANWTNGGSIPFNIGECLISVSYQYRECSSCNPVQYQMKLTGITRSGDCGSLSNSQILTVAHEELIKLSGGLFSTSTLYSFELLTPQCFKWVNDALVDCGYDCCRIKYTVNTLWGTVTQEQMDSPYNCSGATGGECSYSCSIINVDPYAAEEDATGYDCDNDPCSGTEWHQSFVTAESGWEGCVFTIHYSYKKCPDYPKYVMRINRIEYNDFNECVGYGSRNMHIKAIYRIFNKAFDIPGWTLRWETENPDCDTITYLTKKCWYNDDPNESLIWDKCTLTESCCKTQYIVRRAIHPVLGEIRYFDQTYPYWNIEDPEEETCEEHEDWDDGPPYCINFCNDTYINFNYSQYFPYSKIGDFQNEQFSKYVLTSVKSYPNPSNFNIKFDIITEIGEGKCKILIFDLLGNKIADKITSIMYNSSSVEFDNSKLSDGAYNYVIEINGIPNASGMFMITR